MYESLMYMYMYISVYLYLHYSTSRESSKSEDLIPHLPWFYGEDLSYSQDSKLVLLAPPASPQLTDPELNIAYNTQQQLPWSLQPKERLPLAMLEARQDDR